MKAFPIRFQNVDLEVRGHEGHTATTTTKVKGKWVEGEKNMDGSEMRQGVTHIIVKKNKERRRPRSV